MITFKKIDKENYMECISLKVKATQRDFVADNAQSLLDAHYLEGLETLGVYHDDTMVGFLLYDYDTELGGWSLSRFMIGAQYQGKGFGSAALKSFLQFFASNIGTNALIACVNIENKTTLALFQKFGFAFVEEIEYTHLNKTYREMKLVKRDWA
ncbi:MAG: GNAT family N-acetyltransferase [Faecalibacterium sp.]